jgi:cell division protein ZapA
MDTNISINLRIAGRNYPIRTVAGNEEIYRKAGKIIDDKLKEYKARYSGGIGDTQDLLAMVAFFSMVEKLLSETDKQEFESYVSQKITRINQMMADAVLFNL